MKFSKLANNITPYKAQTGNFRIRLDKNESPFDIPNNAKKEILKIVYETSWNRYPNIDAEPLREEIAKFHDIKKENVIVGNGSDEILSLIPKIFEGKTAITMPPTFSMYKHYLKINGMKNTEIPLNKDFSLPVSKILDTVTENTAAIYICNPNNPTGNSFPWEQIEKIINTGIPVIIDEAYAEFSDEKSFIGEAVSRKNTIVLRTFSKAFSAAGLRVGYAVSDAEIIDKLHRVKSPFNVNIISMRIAIYLLRHFEIIQNMISKIIKNREEFLTAIPKDITYPTKTNFVLMNLNAFEYLKEKGIIVRNLNNVIKNHIRVTIGRKDENLEVAKAIKEFIEKKNRMGNL